MIREPSLVVQWLRLHSPNAGGPGSIPGQRTRYHRLQLKMLHAARRQKHPVTPGLAPGPGQKKKEIAIKEVTSTTCKIQRRTYDCYFLLILVIMLRWQQSPSAVILESKKIKSVAISIASPSICHEVMGPDAIILVFWMLTFKPAFSLSFHFHQEAL